MNVKITARGLIINDGKLLVFKLRPADDFWCLPGGKLDADELLSDCIAREIKEETGIEPKVGKLLVVRDELVFEHDVHLLEFFYIIENAEDYLDLDISGASHNHEIHAHEFVDMATTDKNVLPIILKDLVAEINEKGAENVPLRIYSESDFNFIKS